MRADKELGMSRRFAEGGVIYLTDEEWREMLSEKGDCMLERIIPITSDGFDAFAKAVANMAEETRSAR